ncbi:MAG TPA: ABC transporter ATP-binding protein [Anaerolineae bacterium]|nr:ABC transporter ATP-binding protein [Anaerolineae bacterium]
MTGSGHLPLQVDNLRFRYRTREDPALRGVTFQAERGQLILVAGASGCGKTTLMRCINGLIPRSYTGGRLEGTIRLFGEDPAPLSLARVSQLVGTVLQDPEKQIVASYVLNEVAFGLENLGLPRRQIHERVELALDHLGLTRLKNRETFSISGGEKQKVALAGVLAMQPQILLLDEPLASLDPTSSLEALALIRRLADEGMTILLIEHRVEDILRARPDKALFLRDGEQIYFGDIEGFLEIADYREVKLPAAMVLEQAHKTLEDVPPPPPPASANGRPPLVEFDHVSFGYEPEQPVLHDVSLAIRTGDIIALLGPNGAGKTTLIKQAIGLLKPVEGTVRLEGKDTARISTAQVARTLGYVFQSPTHMLFAPTVREELSFGPRNLNVELDALKANVEQAIEILNLRGFEEHPPLALSFGQQKRVTIAAVLAMQSKILAMDEPTAGQDYRNYTNFMNSILALRAEREDLFASILFITHDLDLAVGYANRVILMSEGRIAADGPPEQILADSALLERCRIVPTSLLDLNLRLLPETGRFHRAEALASLVGVDHAAVTRKT